MIDLRGVLRPLRCGRHSNGMLSSHRCIQVRSWRWWARTAAVNPRSGAPCAQLSSLTEVPWLLTVTTLPPVSWNACACASWLATSDRIRSIKSSRRSFSMRWRLVLGTSASMKTRLPAASDALESAWIHGSLPQRTSPVASSNVSHSPACWQWSPAISCSTSLLPNSTPRSRELMRRLFSTLSHVEGVGVVLITHDDDEIALADRVVDVSRMGVSQRAAHAVSSSDIGRQAVNDSPDASSDPVPFTVPDLATAPVLEMTDISFAYGARRVLDHIDLSLRAGEVVMLAGPSGAGKSTLAGIAAGLAHPDTGSVRVLGAQPVPGWWEWRFSSRRGSSFTIPSSMRWPLPRATPALTRVRSACLWSGPSGRSGFVGLDGLDAARRLSFRVARRAAWQSPRSLLWMRRLTSSMSRALLLTRRAVHSSIDSPVNSSMRDARCSLSRTICRSGSVLPTRELYLREGGVASAGDDLEGTQARAARATGAVGPSREAFGAVLS